MGLVVEATHLALDERVALKFLRREALARPEIVSRFAREARAAAKINNDHVARVFDVGGTDDGSPFIVMELLVGEDLETMLASRGTLEVGEAVEYVIQACEGLAAAHALGIIHRDIKPGNIFVTQQAGIRQAKLLDFGISKAGLGHDFQNIDAQSSETTQIMGSPHYMSPEQIRSTKDVDTRADLWSLGVVLFELLTGQTPFEGTEVTGIIARVLHEEHRKVRELRPDLPAELEAVIDKCLAKHPDDRFQNAAELAEALVPFAPKRARASVERAKAVITRASGRASPPESIPPPRPSGSARVSNASSYEGPTLTAATTNVVVSAPPQRSSQRAYAYMAVAAIVLGLAGVTYAFAARRDAAKVDTSATIAPAASTPSTAPEVTVPVVTTPSNPPAEADANTPPVASTPEARPSATTAAATAVTARATAPKPRPQRPVRPAAPSTSSPKPPEPEMDIRHER